MKNSGKENFLQATLLVLAIGLTLVGVWLTHQRKSLHAPSYLPDAAPEQYIFLAVLVFVLSALALGTPLRRFVRPLIVRFLLPLTVLGLIWVTAAMLTIGDRVKGSTEASKVRYYGEGKVLMVGVDAATLAMMRPLIESGDLPTFKRLMDEGSYGTLRSLRTYRPSVNRYGYWSPVVWTSIATGKTPDQHGIFDFTMPDPSRGLGVTRVAMTGDRTARTLWNIFSDSGASVGVIGYWTTWPAEPVNGLVVSSHAGLRGHREEKGGGRIGEFTWQRNLPFLTYPEELMNEIESGVRIPGDLNAEIQERFYDNDSCACRSESEMAVFENVFWQDELYRRVSMYCLDSFEIDFLTIYLEGIDAAGHQFWEYQRHPPDGDSGCDPERLKDIVNNYYRYTDEVLKDLLDKWGDRGTVMIVSDHGMRDDLDMPKQVDHDRDGMFVLWGPGIRSGGDVTSGVSGQWHRLTRKSPTVLDIAPTLLYLMGLPLAEDMPGRVLWEALDANLLEERAPVSVRTYEKKKPERLILRYEGTDHEEDRGAVPQSHEEMTERLRALGYL